MAARWEVSDGILQGHEKVEGWIKQHSDPMYVTDLWFVVKEGESEVRIPACSAILRVTVCSTRETHVSALRDLPQAIGGVSAHVRGAAPEWEL